MKYRLVELPAYSKFFRVGHVPYAAPPPNDALVGRVGEVEQ